MERQQGSEVRGKQASLHTLCEDQRQILRLLLDDFRELTAGRNDAFLEFLRSGASGQTARHNRGHGAAERRVRELRKALAQTEKLTDVCRVLSSLVHEVHQPLTAVGLYAEGCRRLVALGRYEELETILQQIVDQSERAGQIARKMQESVGAGEALNQSLSGSVAACELRKGR